VKVHLKALGCRLNEAELESWARDFRDRGVGVTADAGRADLVVVNTCAVTEEAVRKSRRLLRRVHRDNPHAKIILTGCYSDINKKESSALDGVDLVIDNARKDDLPRLVADTLDLHTSPAIATEPGANLLFARGRQRAFVKVQDGCRYRCTYCVVTIARGDERSRPVASVVEEIRRLELEGVREVVLAGVHLGGYGGDIGTGLGTLVASVLAETGIPRIRLGSLEPWDIPKDFWDLFENPRLMPHLHLPVQSGADSVLRRMARRCRTNEFRRLADSARRRVPGLNITTDVIVGFPGESDDEFAETLGFVREMDFGHVHIFAFSPRQGTKAASLPGAVPEEVKRERSARLHDLARQLRDRQLAHQHGRVVPVLVETLETLAGRKVASGYTPGFFRVAVEAADDRIAVNDIVDVALVGTSPEVLLTGRLANA
jgi:threonylcarbamoyladenosine tRNA methylthiotransferase MtaB